MHKTTLWSNYMIKKSGLDTLDSLSLLVSVDRTKTGHVVTATLFDYNTGKYLIQHTDDESAFIEMTSEICFNIIELGVKKVVLETAGYAWALSESVKAQIKQYGYEIDEYGNIIKLK